MQLHDVFSAPAELKFIEGEPDGTYGGLGAVFGNQDSHDDVIRPGAFADSLAEHKAAGTMPRMYLEHSAFTGGDPLPIGIWTHIEEEAAGLRVKGRLVGMNHPDIARIYELMKVRALPALSIAFQALPDGVIMGRKSNEPRRTLTKVKLVSVDLVGDPSNPLARIDSLKSASQANQSAAAEAIKAAMIAHRAVHADGKAPSAEQIAAIMGHMQTAHQHLTGQAMPPGMKSADTIRELEAWLHDPVDGLGWSLSKARLVAGGGFKASLAPRDEERDQAIAEADRAAVTQALADLADFSLPSF